MLMGYMKTSHTAAHVSLSIPGEYSQCHQSRLDHNLCCTITFQISNIKGYFGIRNHNNQLIFMLVKETVSTSSDHLLVLKEQVLDTLFYMQ